jgi:hypothetical protein
MIARIGSAIVGRSYLPSRRNRPGRNAGLNANGKESQRAVVYGVAIGVAVGALVGLPLHSLGRGICVGIIVGAAIGTIFTLFPRPLGTSQKRSE